MEQLKIKPLNGQLPKPQYFPHVIAPPYDVLTRAEAKHLAAAHPLNILHVTRADAVLPEQVMPYSAHVYAQAGLNIQALRQSGALTEVSDSYLVYQIEKGPFKQTGLIANCDHDDDFIKTHEQVRQDKLNDRIQVLSALEADVSPLLVMHRHHPGLDAFLLRATEPAPEFEGTLADGSVHRLWIQGRTAQLTQYLSEIDALYMADGHHRLAAGRRVRPSILAALFSEQSLNMLAYHRGVFSSAGIDGQTLKTTLADTYAIDTLNGPELPTHFAEIVVYCEGQWLRLKEHAPQVEDLQQQLPSVRLQQHCLAPLQINESQQLCFIGGLDAADVMKQRVDSGELSLGILLPPVEKRTILEMSDRQFDLPAKSTWFEPKVADGLVFL